VQLYDNGQAYGSPAQVSGGTANITAANLTIGIHTITAKYLGDANTLGSTSAGITQVITGTLGLQISGAANGISQAADISVTVN